MSNKKNSNKSKKRGLGRGFDIIKQYGTPKTSNGLNKVIPKRRDRG